MMNILVTLNANYILPLKVMLKSLFLNNPEESFDLYLMHTDIGTGEIAGVRQFVQDSGHSFHELKIRDEALDGAPVVFHYSKEMYYRLLAFRFLPDELDRVLYLDPDILVLNPVKPLYNMDLGDNLYAAAYHNIPAVKEVNRLRLNPYPIDVYYNSGVLLMNLALQRQLVDETKIYQFIEKNQFKLILPDQDILNALFAKEIKALDEKLYNYDARYYHYYKMSSNGQCDMDYIIRNTVFLHFCGKKKPWNKHYGGKFDALYKHYQKLALC